MSEERENPHDRFLFFGTAVPRDHMAEHRTETLQIGDLALYPPKEVLFDKMNKKRMYITADHGVDGVNAQGLPCITKHPVRVGEFLFDYEHTQTGNYDICGMLYGTVAGRAMARRMMRGDDDCLSLSHDTILYTDPATQQKAIGFSGNHVAVLNSSETLPGRDGCYIHHMVPLSKSNSLMNEMMDTKVRKENSRVDHRIEELARNLNSYLSKNPSVVGEPGIVQSPLDPVTMAEQQKAPEAAPPATEAPVQDTTTTTTTAETTPGPTLQELSAQHAELRKTIDQMKADPNQWFASEEQYTAAINSEDPETRVNATKAYAEMAMREKTVSDLAASIKDAEAKAMQAKLETYEKEMKLKEEELKKREEEMKAQSSNTLKGNFNEIMQSCGQEAGMTQERMDAMHRAFDVASSIGGAQGRAMMDGLQIMTTSCSRLGRTKASLAAGRFGQSADAGPSRVSGLFNRGPTTLPFTQTQVRDASTGTKRPASEALPLHEVVKKQAVEEKPVFFMAKLGGQPSSFNPRKYESADFVKGLTTNEAAMRASMAPSSTQ